jgi:hydroxyethylthiazole kinase-like uncharacterized protein yjeF
MHVVTAQQMRDLDRYAIQEVGIPGLVLMENAGSQKVAVLCGKGNNGGDGLVTARYLKDEGVAVEVFLAAAPDRVSGDARLALDIFLRSGGSVRPLGVPEGLAPEDLPLSSFGLIVDALLGTGLKAQVRDPLAGIIRLINHSRVPVLSVDIPSGLCSDTGRALGAAVEAQVTVTFGLPKLGHFLYPGRRLCGELYLVDIGIPGKALEQQDLRCQVITPEMLRGILGPRQPDAHKGHFGHLLVVAGSAGKTGAGVMACEAALRVGAGLVTMALPRSLNLAMEARLTEAMTLPLSEGPEQSLSIAALEEILGALGGKQAVALGPGISTMGETPELVRELVARVCLPMVIDADGLNALVGHLELLRAAPGVRILTPHPGEMARLLSVSTSQVQSDRIQAALELSRRSSSHVILKGAGTVLVEPGGNVRLVPTGNPAMASGGMGDLLTGMIGGLLAQGVGPLEAMALGAYLHGLVADEWAQRTGSRGLMATDLLGLIPGALERLLQGKVRRSWPKALAQGCALYG